MTHPMSLPPQTPRSASDLTAPEAVVAARLQSLPRASLPSHLRGRVLAAAERWEPAVVGPFAGRFASGARPWAAAAALLVGTALGLTSRSSAAPAAHTARTSAPVTTSVRVVDDPSVPLFHGVESFDRLESPLLASGSAGARSPR